MDPNANLREQEEIEGFRSQRGGLHSYGRIRLRELREALRDWLMGGGFEPTWSAYPAATVSFGAWRGAR